MFGHFISTSRIDVEKDWEQGAPSEDSGDPPALFPKLLELKCLAYPPAEAPSVAWEETRTSLCGFPPSWGLTLVLVHAAEVLTEPPDQDQFHRERR